MKNAKALVTIKEVAARSGYSVATVSKALNGRPDISPATSERIRDIAREMGYRPNTAARTLKTNRSRIVGLLFFLRGESVWTHDYFSRIAASIQDILDERGYDISPINCYGTRVMGSYVDYCRYRNYDGVILMSTGALEETLTEFIHSDIPLVMIDSTFAHRGSVVSDNRRGMRELVEHVHAKGHRRLAYIHGEDTSVTRERVQSFRETCQALGITVPEEYVQASEYRDQDKTEEATRALLRLGERPTCIFFPDDYATIGGLNALHDAGLRIPEDISIVGYDGIPLSQALRPRLTTLRQDIVGIGRQAARMLLHAVEKPGKFVPRHVLLTGRVLPGETVRALETAAPPEGNDDTPIA